MKSWGSEYFGNVEKLSDLLAPYSDKKFLLELKKNEVKRDTSNPFFESLSDVEKNRYARTLFRLLMDLIHRSGFMPYRSVEIIIDDEDEDDEKSS